MKLTSEAEQRLKDYLDRVRQAVRGTDASSQEVEQNVREHVAAALPSGDSAGVAELDAVLLRLGDPSAWLAESELPFWRRIARRLSASDSWRLAYGSFALTIFGLITLPIGVGVALLIGAFLLSRTLVDLLRERNEEVGAKRWLIYPPMAFFLAILLGLALVGPIATTAAWFFDGDGYRMIFGSGMRPEPTLENLTLAFGFMAVVAGGWWIFLAAAAATAVQALRYVFRPLLDRIARRHFVALALVGAAVLIFGLLALPIQLRW